MKNGGCPLSNVEPKCDLSCEGSYGTFKVTSRGFIVGISALRINTISNQSLCHCRFSCSWNRALSCSSTTMQFRAKLKELRQKRALVWAAALVCFIVLMLVTPRIPQSESYHQFADQRTFFGVPNFLNVISNFPFLIVGVVGLVLCLHGNHLGLSLQGEVWGWACFYVGVTSTAFGSTYYHLKPDDATLVWDRLPMTIAFSSIMAVFIIERIDERKGTASLAPLLLVGVVSVAYWRLADDLRPYALVQFVPCIAIPAMTIALPPKYTHSVYWLWAAGWYLLAKVEEAMDKTIYRWTNDVVSGHTLKHLCSAMVPVFVTIMLARRSVEIQRHSLWEKWRIQVRTTYFFQEDQLSLAESQNNGEKNSGLQDETEKLLQTRETS